MSRQFPGIISRWQRGGFRHADGIVRRWLPILIFFASLLFLARSEASFPKRVFTFNDADKITSTIYPNSGPTITNEYHAGGSFYRVSRSGYTYYTANAGSVGSENFDEFGRVKVFSFGNSQTTTRGYYTTSKRLQTISSGVFTREYRYSAAEDVTYLAGTGLSATTVTYDNLHRLKTYTGLSGSYGYDPVGNLTNHIESGTAQTFGYGSARKQAVKSAFGKTYLYDNCGNMVVRNGGTTNSQALEYDAENRLMKFSQVGSTAVEYGYAHSGQRLWRRSYVTSTNSPKLQIWIGNHYEEKDSKTLFHVFAGGQRICTFEPGSALATTGGGGAATHVGYYYHQDHLGSSTVMSGPAGQQLEINAFYPFGRTQTASPQANFKVSNQFTGQVKDEETGLYYYGARYFDPELGRFIQADTIIPDFDNPQSYNRYAYVLNNPLRYTDPTGHEPDDLDDIPMTMGAAHAAMRQSAGGESARLYDKNVASAHMMAGGARAVVELHPAVGGFNSAYQVTTGKDAIDAHKLTTKERALSGVNVGLQGAGKVVKAGAAVGAAVVAVKVADGANDLRRLGTLTRVGENLWESAAGLRYGLGSAQGNRVLHVLEHAGDIPTRAGSHGVFSGGRNAVLGSIDEAYKIAQGGGAAVSTVQEGARTVHTVNMGRTIGYVGGQAGAAMGNPAASHVRLVLEGKNVITAFPVKQ
jgi:RHS repeat-associated protein